MFNFTGTKVRQQQLPTDPNTSLAQVHAGGAKPSGVSPMQTAPQTPEGMPNGIEGRENAQIEQRMAEIEAQRQAFARQNPDFDMKSEMQNPDFVTYVWGNGLTVEDAYFLTHRDELFEQARAEAAESILARKRRVPENGVAKNRPAIAKKNPKDLTDEEIDAIIERARNGEKITF